jgi:hypothetical protein
MARSNKQTTRRPATKFTHLQKKMAKARVQKAQVRKPTGKKK